MLRSSTPSCTRASAGSAPRTAATIPAAPRFRRISVGERVVIKSEVAADKRVCPHCCAAMKTIGFSCCEMLDVIPARIIVVQRKDETGACPNDDTIVSAPVPPQIVERGKLLVAHPELFVGDRDALDTPQGLPALGAWPPDQLSRSRPSTPSAPPPLH